VPPARTGKAVQDGWIGPIIPKMNVAEGDYRVELESYSGPLDLLLYLVRRHEIDLHDIPVAVLTEQYLKHLNLMKRIDMNLAGEFLVMAATLLEIKSAMLLPRPEAGGEAEGDAAQLLDPRFELIQQLLAYKRIKEASAALDTRRHDWAARFARHPGRAAVDGQLPDDDQEAALLEFDLDDVHVLDLREAFARILESIGGSSAHEVVVDDTPLGLHAKDIEDRLERDGPMTLQEIFVGRASRSELVGLFLAMLELVRQKKIRIVQDQAGGSIHLELRPPSQRVVEHGDQAPDWRDPVTGKVQYDWPSEQVRQRVESRNAKRFERLKHRQFAQAADEVQVIDVDDEEPQAGGGSDEAPSRAMSERRNPSTSGTTDDQATMSS